MIISFVHVEVHVNGFDEEIWSFNLTANVPCMFAVGHKMYLPKEIKDKYEVTDCLEIEDIEHCYFSSSISDSSISESKYCSYYIVLRCREVYK